MEESLVVCRCEEITVGEIRAAVLDGARTVDEVKRLTRAGMGLCRGATCQEHVARIIAELTGDRSAQIDMPRVRAPVRPVSMESLATHSI